LLIAVLTSIALLSLDQKTRHLESLRTALSLLADPVKYLVDMPITLFRQTADSIHSHTDLKKRK